jgi:hypothetical protein
MRAAFILPGGLIEKSDFIICFFILIYTGYKMLTKKKVIEPEKIH